jgi:hypothetical protein
MSVSSQVVYEDRNSDVGLSEVLRFKVPASLPLLNTQETYLRFNMVVGSQGKQAGFASGDEADIAHWYPWTIGDGGAANLVRNLTIKSSDGTVLEQISDYNRLSRVLANYTENSTEKNLKRLYSGADTDYVKRVNTLTRRTVNDQGASTAGETQENMMVECLLQLKLSGILNNAQPFPNALCGGIEVEIQLEEDAYKVVHAQGHQLGKDAPNFIANVDDRDTVAGYRSDAMTYTCEGTPNDEALTSITISDGNVGAANVYGAAAATTSANFPFFNGQEITVAGTNNIDVVINNIEVDGGKLKINFDAKDFSGNGVANPKVFVKTPNEKPTITLSSLQLVCGVVNPSQKQAAALESAARSGNGYGFQYMCFQDFPVNMQANALQQSLLLNCRYRRCKSIVNFWENVSGSNVLVEKDNLLTQNDSDVKPAAYQYQMAGLLVPNRKVSLDNYTRNRTQAGGWSAVHIMQLEQTVGCLGLQVKDLSNVDSCLMFGRGLVPANSGYFHDLAASNEETRINLQFYTQNQPLLLHSYVYHQKTLVLKANGSKMVVE